MITTVPPHPRTPTSAGAVTNRFPAMRPASSSIDPPTVKLVLTRPLAAAAAVVTSSASRVRGVDAARGIALLGMIAAHTLPLAEGGQPTMVGRLVNGPAAALFGVLAGLSVAMLTGRRRLELGTEPARRYALRLVVRGLAIGSLGLALGQVALASIDVILTYYGVLFVLAVPLVFLSTRVLVVLGAVLTVLAPVTGFLLRAQLPPTELLDPSFTMLVTDPAGLLTTLMFTGAYPVWPWLAYLCIGVAVGRLRLDSPRVAAALAGGGVLLAVVATVASSLILQAAGGIEQLLATPGLSSEELAALSAEGPNGVTPTTSWSWLAVTLPHSSTPFDLARTIGTSLAVLGSMLLLDGLIARSASGTPARVLSAARGPLAAAGSMTLTLYVLHVVVTGLAPESGPWVLFLLQVVAALAVGALWQRRVGRGPLETGVAKLVDAVIAAPSRTTAPTTAVRHRVGSRLQSALAVTVLVVVVAAGAGVALAFPASQDTAAATSAGSETAEETPAEEPGAVEGADGDTAGNPAAGEPTVPDSGDAANAPEPENDGAESGDEG
ncbi:DUF418 domain-containing protein [Actinomycetospora callitridis]|uniref:DUF418 domain-containing protein n=1 Tax=Actinomycetospora callitridis TaxID=913944 RepID=UPI0023665755|nr:heparan-alpha-glucosaminide N-acetyltransferase domain-containing protein [Actinomycetospora callitridis]MDD7921259.1 heparan-alpha-glucosaminide N-acetyltransferase domain-containing protein [Actinomycetospora callitridis]